MFMLALTECAAVEGWTILVSKNGRKEGRNLGWGVWSKEIW
jgi:hypothetical protein